ncbi:MAG: DUF2127 domain-containing protein [Verrucomicrobia bacterium]|nr:DUF2127 domain-containing protein [Verrucomicrobiota bacterium]
MSVRLDTTFPQRRAPALYVIIVLKLGKALLLLALALGFFSLIGQDIDAQFDRLLRLLYLNPEQHFLAALGQKLQRITPSKLRWLGSGSLLYSMLLLVESTGLIRRSWWAVWLAIGETAFFIPFEVMDLLEHFSWVVLVILLLNNIIVWYLVKNRERLFRHHHPVQDEPDPEVSSAPDI